MIRLRDALTLALTKLRTRRVRTTVTVIIASLLFGVMTLATFVVQGVTDSMQRFTSGTLSERYLAMVSYSPQRGGGPAEAPDSVKERAQQLYTQMVSDKKAAAKKLGIEYDPTMEQKPIDQADDMKWLNPSSPAAVQAYNEYAATFPTATQEVDEVVAKYSSIKAYPVITGGPGREQLKPIVDGKEDFTKRPEYSPDPSKQTLNFGWSYVDQSVVKPFMLTAEQLARQTDMSAIPVIAPIGQVESALGLGRMPGSATAEEKLARLQYVKAHAEQATYISCYRNSVSQQQIDDALRVAKEIEQNKSNKDYQKPSLIYGLPPADACAQAPVVRDVRTAAEKQLAAKQREFAAQFGQAVDPIQRKLTFRVVGISPNALSADSFTGIDGLLTTIAGSTLEGQWVVPRQLFEAMPNREELMPLIQPAAQDVTIFNDDSDRRLVEFSNVADLKRFVEKMGCGMMYCDPGHISATYFGSNTVLIEDIRTKAVEVLRYVALVVTIIAALILMGMIGRVIGDSRRETAVFRAIGATRNDIRSIYVSYTIMLTVIVALVAMALGLAAAWWIDTKLSGDFTVRAHLIYIFSDDASRFSLVGIWWTALASVGCLVVVAGLVGMLLPLSRNLTRSPIKDMRDDT
jgi:hypothetical protein